MMKPAVSKNRLLRAALGAMLGAAVLMGDMGSGARADDEDDALDVRILRNVLKTLGLRRGDEDGINYRERSPLVVPPNRNLVPPSTARAPEKNPAWPNDPDVKRRKEAKTKSKEPISVVDSVIENSRPLRPNEMRAGGTGTGRQAATENRKTDGDSPMKPSELGYKGGLFGSMFGGPKEEYQTFTGETPRANLIEPPTGYRTPSPNQPYGVGREKWTPPKIDRLEPVR